MGIWRLVNFDILFENTTLLLEYLVKFMRYRLRMGKTY